MACPGGCIGGGGQPQPVNAEIRAARTAALYSVDELKTLRQSHKNPDVIALYDTWLGKPLGEKSHHLLHTHYNPQPESCKIRNGTDEREKRRLLPFFICPLFYGRLFISAVSQFSGEYLRSIIVHAKSGPTSFVTPRCAPSAWAEI